MAPVESIWVDTGTATLTVGQSEKSSSNAFGRKRRRRKIVLELCCFVAFISGVYLLGHFIGNVRVRSYLYEQREALNKTDEPVRPIEIGPIRHVLVSTQTCYAGGW